MTTTIVLPPWAETLADSAPAAVLGAILGVLPAAVVAGIPDAIREKAEEAARLELRKRIGDAVCPVVDVVATGAAPVAKISG